MPAPIPEHILIIDDDEDFRMITVRRFERLGWRVLSAESAEQALALAQEQQPGCALLDLKLGHDSGLHLITPLCEAVPGINIVVLTGYASLATCVEAIRLGASNYLPKPADTSAIVEAFSGNADPVAMSDDDPISLEMLEWEHINRVLKECDGNVTAAARVLGLHRRTLQRKLAKRPASR